MSNVPPPLGNSPSGNPNTPANSPSGNPNTQTGPTVVNQAANTANQANAVLSAPGQPVAPLTTPQNPSVSGAPLTTPQNPSVSGAPANTPHNSSISVAPINVPPNKYRKFKEKHPVSVAVGETTVNTGAALGAGFGIAGTAFVQNSILLGGTLASATMSAAGPILDGGIDVLRRFGNKKRKRAVETEWSDYTQELIKSLGAYAQQRALPMPVVSQSELQQLLSNHLDKTDAELIDEPAEQDLIKALHNCGVFILADIPPHIENNLKPEVCAKWCVARAAKVCAEALSFYQTNANWKRDKKFAQLSPQEFKSLVDHSDPMKYDHLIQVSVAYARFVSRQRERGKVLGKGIRNVGTGSVLSLSTGNPFPIATSLAYEGYKWWSRSQEEKDAFLRINAKGRLVGKDGSEDLQDPKTAKRAEIFFTSDALKQWKSGTDLASDAQASAYYNQIDLLLRHESLGGYRDASKLASAAQAKLVRHVGTIRKPKPKLSVEERKKLTDRKSTLEEKINTIDSELVGLNSQIVDAKDTWDELQRGLAGVPQNQRAALEQNVIKARQAHSALVARSLRLTDERRVADGYLHDPDKGIEKKLQDDEHSEGAVQTLDELDNSPAFEKAFCVWVNNHLEHTPTRARAIAGSTVRAPVARIIVREFKNAVVATAGSAATGAVIGFGGSLIPGLNVVVNPGVFASVGAIAGAAGFIKSAAKRMLDGSFFRIEAAPTSPTPTNPQTPAPPASGSASH